MPPVQNHFKMYARMFVFSYFLICILLLVLQISSFASIKSIYYLYIQKVVNMLSCPIGFTFRSEYCQSTHLFNTEHND